MSSHGHYSLNYRVSRPDLGLEGIVRPRLPPAVPPAEEPVTVAEAKVHMKILCDDVDGDAEIARFITAARVSLERSSQRVFIAQTIIGELNRWPFGRRIELPLPSLQSIVSVEFFDEDDTLFIFDAINYIADTSDYTHGLVLKNQSSWPSTCLRAANGINISYISGYPTAADVPENIKQAILLLTAHFYLHREMAVATNNLFEYPFNVQMLVAQFSDRRVRI